jgi:prolycopene isomerase
MSQLPIPREGVGFSSFGARVIYRLDETIRLKVNIYKAFLTRLKRRFSMSDYDVVVIGAGNGGLTSALTLARNGAKVLLLERHNIPGGCATSFIRGRFEFEVALHQLSGMGTEDRPGPLRGLLGELGVMDQIDFVEMQTLYRVVVPGVLDITLQAERNNAVEALKERFPREKEAIERFFELVYNFCREMVSIAFLRDPEASREKYPLYFKYALKNSQAILDDFFSDPALQMVISIYWPYVGLPPRRMPFGDLAMLLWAYLEFKPFHIKGTSQALSNAILDAFIRAGGGSRFNCGAKKILVSGGQIRGVTTEDGDTVSTGYVVSNAGTLTTYVDLIDRGHVPVEQLRLLGGKTVGPSAFTVFLGFDCEPGEIGIQETTNFLGMNMDADRQFARWRTLENPEVALLSCYDVSDPEFSPPGTCQAALVSLQYVDPWLSIPPTQYAETKYRYAQGMLGLATKVFPDLRDHIEEVEAATPLTHMRYLGHPGGSIYGFDQYAKDSNLFEERKSPIRGLFFAGSWVGPGGFQTTLASGVSAARAVLKSMQKG